MKNKKNLKEKSIANVYQYCSFNTFMSMMENNEIWVSDINKMNDYEEDKTLDKLLRNLLDYMVRENEKLKRKNRDYEEKIEGLSKRLFSSEYLKVGEVPKKFISCFSAHGDILSQWRAYADDGRGFAIGFKKLELERLIKKLNDYEIKFYLSDITYLKSFEKKDSNELFNKYYNEILEVPALNIFEGLTNDKEFYEKIEIVEGEYIYPHQVMSKFMNKFYEKMDKDVKIQNKKEYQELLAVQSCFYKNYYFNEEKEYRILLIDFSKTNREYSKKEMKNNYIKISPILYRNRNDSLIQYRKIKFSSKLFKNLICEIYIGSKNNTTIDEVKEILKHYNLYSETIKIKKSEASYR